MIEKEFKELLNSIELTSNTKKEITSFTNAVKTALESSKYLHVVEISLEKNITDYLNDAKAFNFIVVYNLKNKTLPYELLQKVVFNEAFNLIVINLKNNLLTKDDKLDFTSYYDNNILKIKCTDYIINLNFKYLKEIKINDEETSFQYEQYLAQKRFFDLMNKEYSRFNQILLLIEHFSISINAEFNYLLNAIILSYALENYETDNSIIGYLKSYIFGLTDLIEEKTIIVEEDIYKKLNVLGQIISNKDKYKVIDVSNKQNNLFKYDIKYFKELKSFIFSKFPRDGNFVTLEIEPSFIIKDKSIAWYFKIINTDISNTGGEYLFNEDNYKMCLYKGLLKGLQFISKNKLGNNVIVLVNSMEIFPSKNKISELSYENQSRYVNVLAYIKENDLGVEYKLK